MNKADLVKAIGDDADLTPKQAAAALEAFMSSVKGELAKGKRISLVGFGSFSVDRREARTGRNPRTGEEIQIAAKNVVKFKPGAGLSDAVN